MNANKKIMGAFEAISSLGTAANNLYDSGIRRGVEGIKMREVNSISKAMEKGVDDKALKGKIEGVTDRWSSYDKAADVMTSSGFKKTMGAGAATAATFGTAYGGYRLMTSGRDR